MIRDKIQSKLGKAFDKKLSDAVHPFTCSKAINSGDFDFVTQTYPVTTIETYRGRGVLFGSFEKQLVKPSDYQTEDAKAILLQNEVTAVPQIGDMWDTAKGKFKVIDVGADAADVTWVCQIRKV